MSAKAIPNRASGVAAKPVRLVSQRNRDHRFYTAMSLAIAAVVFAGFGRTYYLKAHFDTPELSPLLHIHGAISTLWIVLYVMQNVLILKGRTNVHRRLGWAISALSVLLLIVAVPTAIGAVIRGHYTPASDPYTSLLAFSFRNLFNFALMLSAAIYWRRNAEMHKRLALLAAIALFSDPAIGRLPGLTPVMMLLLFVLFHLAGPVYDLLVDDRIHMVYLWAVPYLLVSIALAIVAARSPLWHSVADWLMK